MHRILERQIRRSFGETFAIPAEWKEFLELVSDTYTHLDEDRALLNRSLELSSKEFLDNNRRLEETRAEVERQAKTLAVQVAERTKELDERIAELEDARKATTNLLEDLEEEKKRSEGLAKDLEKFKLAVDDVSDNIIIADPEGIVIYANKSVERITGYAPEEVIGRKSGALWSAPMPAEYYQIMWDIIKRQKKVFVGEIQNKRRNGELYTAALSISPLLDKNGDVMFFVGVERDITKEKEIDRAKSEFVSLASHQLRTPPSIIGWYTETLQSGDLGPINEKQADYLAEIYRANQRMIAVINSLLNISRIEMNSFSMSPRETDVTGIIDETIRELNVRFNRTITIRKHYDPALGFFNVDPNIAEIIVENLLSNSFKYTPPENAEIEITAKRDHDALFLSVQDNGIGILPKDEGQIFEKLFRADNAIATNPDGTGLGLYMIKKIIVNGLGGRIWFNSPVPPSTEGKPAAPGTVFYVSIPISRMTEKTGTTKLVRVPSR